MKTACFTGHRPRGLRGYAGHEVGDAELVDETLARAPAMAAMPKGGRP